MHISVFNNIDGMAAKCKMEIVKHKVYYAVLEKCKVEDIDGMAAMRKVEYAISNKCKVQSGKY